MFTIVTGMPGASKTLNVISRLRSVTDRPVYYHGIRLTDKGKHELGWFELDATQAELWHEHLPDDAILIIDEAQKIFPKRPNGAPIPPGLSALETHRHRGWDVYFITQSPNFLHIHARDCCNEHWHFSRSFGTHKPYLYHSGSGYVDIRDSKKLRFECVRSKVPLDTSCYDLYKSAEVHTHKKRVPLKVVLLWVLPLLGLLAVYASYRVISGFGDPAPSSAPDPVASSSSGTLLPTSVLPSQSRATDWSSALTPQVTGLPFTAPLYDKEASKVSAVPRIAACIASKRSCSCYTQQATPISGIPDQACRVYVRDGYFNHMYEEKTEGGRGARARASAPISDDEQPVTSMARLERAIKITQATRLSAIE